MVASAKLQRVLMVALVVLVAAIVVVLTTGQGGGGSPTATASAEFEGPTMPAGLRAHDFTLRDQNGRPVSLAADRGHVVILTFIHSLCHDTCPFMVEQIKGALNLLPGNGAGVPAIGVSAYPSEDTGGPPPGVPGQARDDRSAGLRQRPRAGHAPDLQGLRDPAGHPEGRSLDVRDPDRQARASSGSGSRPTSSPPKRSPTTSGRSSASPPSRRRAARCPRERHGFGVVRAQRTAASSATATNSRARYSSE